MTEDVQQTADRFDERPITLVPVGGTVDRVRGVHAVGVPSEVEEVVRAVCVEGVVGAAGAEPASEPVGRRRQR